MRQTSFTTLSMPYRTFRLEPVSHLTIREPMSSTPMTVPYVPAGGACGSLISTSSTRVPAGYNSLALRIIRGVGMVFLGWFISHPPAGWAGIGIQSMYYPRLSPSRTPDASGQWLPVRVCPSRLTPQRKFLLLHKIFSLFFLPRPPAGALFCLTLFRLTSSPSPWYHGKS